MTLLKVLELRSLYCYQELELEKNPGKITQYLLAETDAMDSSKSEKYMQEVYESKGNEFEKYVVDLFDERYFSIVQWTTDITRKHNRIVEADMGPDLVMRCKSNNEMFCVECKFRSYLYDDKLQWSNPDQLDRYQEYALEKRLPFFVVIGLGGDPTYPKRMFCIPLEEAKYPSLFPSIFEKFERILIRTFSGKTVF